MLSSLYWIFFREKKERNETTAVEKLKDRALSFYNTHFLVHFTGTVFVTSYEHVLQNIQKFQKREKERNQKNNKKHKKKHSIYYNHLHISRMLPQLQVTFNVKDTPSPAPDQIPAQEQKKKKLVRKFHSFWNIYMYI